MAVQADDAEATDKLATAEDCLELEFEAVPDAELPAVWEVDALVELATLTTSEAHPEHLKNPRHPSNLPFAQT